MLLTVLHLLLPSGGQLHARRNAGMSADAARARGRREAEVALLQAERAVAAPSTVAR